MTGAYMAMAVVVNGLVMLLRITSPFFLWGGIAGLCGLLIIMARGLAASCA